MSSLANRLPSRKLVCCSDVIKYYCFVQVTLHSTSAETPLLTPIVNTMNKIGPLLPEIWEVIFDKVEETAQEWYSLYQASPTCFQNVVGKNRAAVLFPLVFPFVLRVLLKRRTTLDEILGLRLVSPFWKEAVDRALLESESATASKVKGKYELIESVQLAQFLSMFESHSGNPVVGRTVGFKFASGRRNRDDMMEYSHLVSRFMDKFGAHLGGLVISGWTNNNVAVRLETVLGCASQLQSLSVYYYATTTSSTGDGNHHQAVAVTVVPPGGSLEPPRPSPVKPPALKSLVLKRCSSGATGNGVLIGGGGGGELRNLIVRLCCNNPESLKRVEISGVPSELLHFRKVESAIVWITEEEEDYSRLASCLWPLLTRLKLCAPSGDTRKVFETASTFKRTLTYLSVNMSLVMGGSPADDGHHFRVDLPNLQYLKIWVDTPGADFQIVSFDMFASLTNLRSLVVGGSIQYHSCWAAPGDFKRQVLQSRIFELLPKLGKICLVLCIPAPDDLTHSLKNIVKQVSRESYQEELGKW